MTPSSAKLLLQCAGVLCVFSIGNFLVVGWGFETAWEAMLLVFAAMIIWMFVESILEVPGRLLRWLRLRAHRRRIDALTSVLHDNDDKP